ncbi:hypothetical protein L6452_22565 [Arctium lappa]|uniref:Uncharacterized protein n=1 Tax=Arctium lappa TaxID=4217 RepID=A0ACB9AZR0_ARCLA|nr:hypothetical protein L6452_22565 [Arctium lappa]
MKPHSSIITIFLCSSSRRLFIRTTTPPRFFNSDRRPLVGIPYFSTSSSDSSASSSYHSSSRRNPEDVRNVRVSVWWDFENCSIPCKVNVYKVTQCITSAVRANGIKGPIQITAFGDVLQLSRSNQEALSSTGINLTHIPNGGKNSADRSLLVDLMYWVSQNPPPAHLFLISGDRDFANILHRLRMNNYNILLASKENAPAVLCSAASIMWQWTALVKGENLSGKHFNQPPDGPYASWYGHYRGPLDDPFASCNQTSCVQSEEVSDSNSEAKLRPVPKAIVNVIRNILNLYPKGLSITELRAELGKSNVTIEKDLYGHKKFSRFLSAMPFLLRLQNVKDGQFIVHGVGSKSRETCVPTTDTATSPSTTIKDSVPVVASVEDGSHNTYVPPQEEILSSSSKLDVPKLSTDSQALPGKQEESHQGEEILSSSSKLKVSKLSTESQALPEKQEPQEVQEQPPLIEKAKEGEVNLGQLYPMKMKRPVPEVGIFKSIWQKWFKGNDGHQEKTCHTINEGSISQNSTDTVNADVKSVQSKDQSSDLGKLPPSYLSTNERIQDAKVVQKSAENVDKASKPRGILNQIVRCCKFWQSDKNSDNLNAEVSKSDKEASSHSEMQEIFTESFWNDMLAFLETSEGSVSVLQSKTRQEMVQNLQRFGPCRLQTLSEKHILHLVELLISEKKWVVESPSQTFPFRLIGGGSSKRSNSKESTKLSTQFTESDSNLRGQERQVGGSMLPIKEKASPKSRRQILSDCQKLVNEVVKEYPDGFNISSFKKLFLDRYGYHLEVQQLGHQKLATVLQIMPGVMLESNYILPDHSRGLRSEKIDPIVEEYTKSDLSRMEDDTQWDELGPIARMNTKKDDGKINGDFETVSDNDLSDSEEDSSTRGLRNEAKRRTEADSSLLQILDSWYSNKEDSNSRIASECTSDMNVDHVNGTKKPSCLSSQADRNDPKWINSEQKQKPSKRYSFVADKPTNDKNLIDGILGSLKKSGNGSPEPKIEG